MRQPRGDAAAGHQQVPPGARFLRGLNTLGDDGQAVRHQVLSRLARHADFSTGWEDDRQRAEELVTRIRELAGETDAMPPPRVRRPSRGRPPSRPTTPGSRTPKNRRLALEALKRDLYQAFRVTDPAERRAILGSVLPRHLHLS